MRRHAIGILSILFLISYGIIHVLIGLDDNTWQMAAGVCQRVGLVLGAAWLAYDQVRQLAKKVPGWLAGSLLLGLAVAIAKPRAIWYLLPVLAALALLQFIGWLFKPLPVSAKRQDDRRSGRRGDPQ